MPRFDDATQGGVWEDACGLRGLDIGFTWGRISTGIDIYGKERFAMECAAQSERRRVVAQSSGLLYSGRVPLACTGCTDVIILLYQGDDHCDLLLLESALLNCFHSTTSTPAIQSVIVPHPLA